MEIAFALISTHQGTDPPPPTSVVNRELLSCIIGRKKTAIKFIFSLTIVNFDCLYILILTAKSLFRIRERTSDLRPDE